MADIFISYAQKDRAWVEPFARMLVSGGWSVWWDRRIDVGEPFDEVIARELADAGCVVVVWSRAAVGSRWVKSEARAAEKRNILVPVVIDDAQLPLGLDDVEAARLATPEGPKEELDRCLAAIQAILGRLTVQPTRFRGQPRVRRTSLIVMAMLLLAAAVGAWSLRDAWRVWRLERALQRMANVAADHPASRFTAAPGPAVARVATASVQETGTSLSDAAADVLRCAKSCPSNEVRAVAFTRILMREPDKAVQALRNAVSAANSNGALRSDLAAARYEAAMAAGRPIDLVTALVDADHAIQIEPSLAPAHFNRALIVEELGITREAAGAWRSFLRVDRDSAWSAVGEKRLAALVRGTGDWDVVRKSLLAAIDEGDGAAVLQIVRTHHQEARAYGENDVLREWGKRFLHPEGGAEPFLRIARAIGDSLRQATGESMLSDAVTAIDEAARRGQAAALAEAHAAYPEASREPFNDPGLSNRVAYHRVRGLLDQGRAEDALRLSAPLLARERAERPSHRSFIAELLWSIALCHVALKQWDQAIVAATDARRVFSALEENANAGAVDALIADICDYLEQPERAWRSRVPAFRLTSAAGDRRVLRTALAGASSAELRAGRWDTALALMNLEIEVVGSLEDREALASLLTRRSRALLRKGDRAAALRDIRDARRLVSGPNLDLDVTEGLLVRDLDPRRSVKSLSRAIDLAGSSRPLDLPDLLLERARSFIAAGDDASAERDLLAGIADVEARSSASGGPQAQAGALNTAAELFAETIRLRIRQQRFDAAFEAVESANRQNLRDEGGVAAPPIGLRGLRERLAPGTTVVEFYLLPEKMVVFLVSSSDFRTFVRDVPRLRILSASAELTRALQQREPEAAIQQRASVLHEMLFDTVNVESTQSLIVIPNDILQRIPFSVLYDRRTRRYLIESSTISVAPSVAVFVNTALRARRLAKTQASAVAVITEPAAILTPEYGTVPPITAGMLSEARDIAAHYPQATLLTLGDATERRFESSARTSDVIHFAGHAISDELRPENSRLLFAPDEARDGALHAREIARLDLDRVRLVVLAASNTMPVRNAGVGRKPGIAASFLSAGVPNVVVALSEFEDASSARFFTRLHASITAGAMPVVAVRDAQLALLRSANRELAYPGSWAPFEVFGGSGTDLVR